MRQLLEGIYTEHRQGLFTLALSILRNADAAEDAIHEAIARLCRMDHNPAGDAAAYVFAAVRNAAMDQRRRGARAAGNAETIFENSLSSHDAAPDQPMEQSDQDRLIRRAVEELPDESRQVVVMKIYACLTFEQIAQALNEPLSTVSSRYQRALSKLREKLETLV